VCAYVLMFVVLCGVWPTSARRSTLARQVQLENWNDSVISVTGPGQEGTTTTTAVSSISSGLLQLLLWLLLLLRLQLLLLVQPLLCLWCRYCWRARLLTFCVKSVRIEVWSEVVRLCVPRRPVRVCCQFYSRKSRMADFFTTYCAAIQLSHLSYELCVFEKSPIFSSILTRCSINLNFVPKCIKTLHFHTQINLKNFWGRGCLLHSPLFRPICWWGEDTPLSTFLYTQFVCSQCP